MDHSSLIRTLNPIQISPILDAKLEPVRLVYLYILVYNIEQMESMSLIS